MTDHNNEWSTLPMTDPLTAWVAANKAAQPLHDRAIMLGYNVGCSATGETRARARGFVLGATVRPAIGYRTHLRLSRRCGHIPRHLETLPVYCLELLGNPRVRTELDAASDGIATWIIDTETDQRFGVRTADLENITRLCVHAESQPTIGNWEPA